MKASLDHLLGLHAAVAALTWGQIGARTVIVFLVGVILLRLADCRFLGHNAGFDVLLAVVLGSVLSRGVNGQAPFFETLGASALLVVLHRLLAAIACRSPAVSRLVKGGAVVLVKDGRVRKDALRRADISLDDLNENLRLNAIARVADVAEARLERNGEISVVKLDDAGE
jgi:uncharacterized membrane protein YcaP (DUF421 family)